MQKNSFTWLGDSFLLESESAMNLYHDYAKNLPIIDFHNHLAPSVIANNCRFDTITDLWLSGDHYKWRLMRAMGIEEKYVTGQATSWEKFEKWAHVVPNLVGNPLFHWSCMELERYFGIKEILTPENAKKIYDQCNEKLQGGDFSAQSLLKKMNVEIICTTDDPVDSLFYHNKMESEKMNRQSLRMFPSWRADRLLLVEDASAWNAYIDRLAEKSQINIVSLNDLELALQQQLEHFLSLGCKVADIGITRLPNFNGSIEKCKRLFTQLRLNENLSLAESDDLKFGILVMLCRLNHKNDLKQQLHIGPLRNNNSRLLNEVGVDCGIDSMADDLVAKALAVLLDYLEKTDSLTPTILYNLNPKDGDVLATMAYNFNGDGKKGKMQYGAAWWFLDNHDGIERQLSTISNYGLLSQFVGMLTDSRSLLSFVRHEYFRRILSNYLGKMFDKGYLPADLLPVVGGQVEDICYYNAKRYFEFD